MRFFSCKKKRKRQRASAGAGSGGGRRSMPARPLAALPPLPLSLSPSRAGARRAVAGAQRRDEERVAASLPGPGAPRCAGPAAPRAERVPAPLRRSRGGRTVRGTRGETAPADATGERWAGPAGSRGDGDVGHVPSRAASGCFYCWAFWGTS